MREDYRIISNQDAGGTAHEATSVVGIQVLGVQDKCTGAESTDIGGKACRRQEAGGIECTYHIINPPPIRF